ncbi:hypothetical protein RRG08_027312 [Elysia crispata]|uniref:C-type lectin domain-containing protein n=1 Tax=Elysia crispata TaxID=231223 RepID=A0AAE0ZAF0_9GAST|nr:hypothetical protein RRG08_027312 [Elysia crispata]
MYRLYSLVLVGSLLCLFTVPVTCTDLALCPSGWLTSLTSRSCILPYKKFKSWDEARVWCKADAGDLLIKVDKEKLNLLYENHIRGAFWIGLNDKRQEGKFIWLDDKQTITNITWDRYEPNNNDNGDCVFMSIHASYHKTMADDPCDKKYYFICEMFPDCFTNTFGADCSEICSANCGGPSNACDNFSGFCLYGCDDGYQGERCEAECAHNTFGANCSEICSPNCGGPNNACDNFSGFCIDGCDDGYQGERCEAASYGRQTEPTNWLAYTVVALVTASTFGSLQHVFFAL